MKRVLINVCVGFAVFVSLFAFENVGPVWFRLLKKIALAVLMCFLIYKFFTMPKL